MVSMDASPRMRWWHDPPSLHTSPYIHHHQVGTDIAQIEVAEATTNFLTLIIGVTVLIGVLLILSIFLYVRIKRACGRGKY